MALVVILGVVAYEWRKRSQSAHSGVVATADDLTATAAIREPETGEY